MRNTSRLINVSPLTGNCAITEEMDQCVLTAPAPRYAETIDIATDVATWKAKPARRFRER
jgi:hypothetical protein